MSFSIRSSSTLGHAIRRARRVAGFTQQDLATRTTLRQGTISRLESGVGGTLETLFAVTTALGLDVQLVARNAEPPALDDLF